MQTVLRTRRTSAGVVAGVIAVLSLLTAGTGVGVALATSKLNPVWPNGTIHQCLNNKTYATRTLPRGKKCSAHETAYTFSRTGPRGAPGPAGLGGVAFSGGDALVPPSTGATSVIKSVTITTTSRGSLLVLDADLGGATFNTSDVNQTTEYFAGVYVDGHGVPGTGLGNVASVPPNDPSYSISAVTLDPGAITGVAAGKHTVSIELRSTDAQANYVTSGTGTLLVVASR